MSSKAANKRILVAEDEPDVLALISTNLQSAGFNVTKAENGLVALNQASMYHWRQRDDCNNERLSVGCWQASRIQALLGNAAEAVRLGEVCLSYSVGLKPFYLGYAYEALARAHGLAGNTKDSTLHLRSAQDFAARIGDKGDRELLVADLEQLKSPA